MSRAFKAQLYEQFARVTKAASSPQRLELLDLLLQGERTVEALASASEQPIANASHHLRVLKQARLVESRKAGLYVYYRLAGPTVFHFLRSVRALAEQQLVEVEDVVHRYLGKRDELTPVSREELACRIRAGDVTVLDVRPAEEYLAGHIPGALSIPIKELKRRLAELPPGKQIVAYCRGPYCVYAYQAVEILRACGFAAQRLVDGLPEWRAAGLPVETSQPPRRTCFRPKRSERRLAR
jgi:rhodanese-related sulfurtransferase